MHSEKRHAHTHTHLLMTMEAVFHSLSIQHGLFPFFPSPFYHFSMASRAPGKTPAENFGGSDPKAAIDKQRAAGQDLPSFSRFSPSQKWSQICVNIVNPVQYVDIKKCLGVFFSGVSGKID